ncbi:MAG: GAF domain-containing protein [Gammaproteobacteria bacterium]|nr:GAF domain-containing protein [Gammaproteobacteria bacterium]
MSLNTSFINAQLQYIIEAVGMEVAILSKIYDQKYEVISIVPEVPFVKPGSIFPLESRLCMEVVRKQRLVHYHYIFSIEELRDHPVYKAIQPEAYIGCPVYANGELWGTINTMAFYPKLEGFTDYQLEIVRTAAAEIALSIEERVA